MLEKGVSFFMRNLFNLIVALSVLLAASAHAQQDNSRDEAGRTEQRLALVIGNSDYTAGPLKNPVNDARDMTQTLKELGFEVIHKENLTQNDMKRAIREFGAKLRQGGVGLFYYAGYGVQVAGDNYLIPVDSTPSSEEEIEYEAVNAGLVLAQMASARNGMNIVILDACRNNPFARSFRTLSDGLARINAPNGTLIAYATAPGSVVSDVSDDRNGIYTQELLKFIRRPGLSIEEVFKRVRIAVRSRTRNRQIPWEESSLTGNFYFAKGKANEASQAADAAATEDNGVGVEGVSGSEQTKADSILIPGADLRMQTNANQLYERLRSSKKEDYSKAIAQYREALRLEPNNAAYHNALGNALKKKAEWEWIEVVKAQDEPRKKVERKRMWLAILATAAAAAIGGPGSAPPRVPDWEVRRGELLPFNIDTEIVTELEAAVELEPRNAKYYNDFGLALFESRNNVNIIGTAAEVEVIAKAETALREAVSLEPNNPIFLNSLGSALNSQDKWAEAEAEYRKLLELEPGNVSHYIGLLRALNGQSKWTEAAQVYIDSQRLKRDSYSKTLLSYEIKDKKELQREIKRLKSKRAS